MNKDVRKLMKQAQRQGFAIRRGGKHWKSVGPDGRVFGQSSVRRNNTRRSEIAKMRELTGRALDCGLFDGEWTVEDV